MLKIALTGSIASGKSTVSSLFRKIGIFTVSADEIARELTAKNTLVLETIQKHFGHSVIDAQGNLDRKALRNHIFENNHERLWLNELLHPLIRDELKKRADLAEGPYVLIEIPLLNTPKDYPYLDRILLVIADEKEQITRIVQRDKSTLEEARAIIASQISNEERKAFATEIIYNHGNLAELKADVEVMHQKYLQLSFKN